MPLLSTKARLALPDSSFGLPEQRACPMPDGNHARNAKARAEEEFDKGNLTGAEKQRIGVMADDILARTWRIITSQFLCRGAGDKPAVLPAAWANLALVGQFCELPEDVVSTVEYSIRSAQVAVYGLLGIKRAPPDVYRGTFDPRVL